MISSSKSRTSVPSRVTCNRKLETFFAYIWLACTGTVLGRLTGPRISTPCRRTSVPASASSQFPPVSTARSTRSEEHTSELQSPYDLVCRLLLEKKKKQNKHMNTLHDCAIILLTTAQI